MGYPDAISLIVARCITDRDDPGLEISRDEISKRCPGVIVIVSIGADLR